MKRSIELRRNKYARDREAMSAPWTRKNQRGIQGHDILHMQSSCNQNESLIDLYNGALHSFYLFLFLAWEPKVDSKGTKEWAEWACWFFKLHSFSLRQIVKICQDVKHMFKSFALHCSDLRWINEASMPNLHSPNASGGQRAWFHDIACFQRLQWVEFRKGQVTGHRN